MKQGSIKCTETRNDGITAQLSEKSLHFEIYKFLITSIIYLSTYTYHLGSHVTHYCVMG